MEIKRYTYESQLEAIQQEINSLKNSIVSIENCYPVGSIYMSINTENPNTIFNFGTWEQIEDRFLLAAGSSYTSGNTGGEATHKLTVNEMPSHRHTSKGWAAVTDYSGDYYTLGAQGQSDTYSTNYTGGGQAHNNMPPYLVVNIWKRVA